MMMMTIMMMMMMMMMMRRRRRRRRRRLVMMIELITLDCIDVVVYRYIIWVWGKGGAGVAIVSRTELCEL